MPMILPIEIAPLPEPDKTPITVDIYMRSGQTVRGVMPRFQLSYWKVSIIGEQKSMTFSYVTSAERVNVFLVGDAPAFLMDCVGFRIVPVSEGGNGNGL